MKSTQLVIFGMAVACSVAFATYSACGQDFRARVNEVCIYTNQTGNLVYERVNTADIIRECASEKGITNLMGLSLVYNRTADALQVIRGTNLTAICTPLSFSGGTWLINSNHMRAERLAFVSVETNNSVNGTLAATERFAYGPTNELTFFSLHGQLQYTVPARGTNPPVIYTGTLSAGNPARIEQEGEQGEAGGNNGRGQGRHGLAPAHGHGNRG